MRGCELRALRNEVALHVAYVGVFGEQALHQRVVVAHRRAPTPRARNRAPGSRGSTAAPRPRRRHGPRTHQSRSTPCRSSVTSTIAVSPPAKACGRHDCHLALDHALFDQARAPGAARWPATRGRLRPAPGSSARRRLAAVSGGDDPPHPWGLIVIIYCKLALIMDENHSTMSV